MGSRIESKPLLWITDPWETLDHPRDTTLRLIEECSVLGMESSWCDVRTIRYEEGKVILPSRKVESIYPGRLKENIRLGEIEIREPGDFSKVFYRTDPPVDVAYTHPLQILALSIREGNRDAPELVPPFEVLFRHNEKLEAALIDLLPPSIAAADPSSLIDWGTREKKAVLKPLHQAGSRGVELLDFSNEAGRAEAEKRLREVTRNGCDPVLLQRYLPGIEQGEQRLWFLDGKLHAFARKVPRPGDFRIDMDRGGVLVRTELSESEKKTATRIGAHLKKLGVRMAAVDLIDGYVTDFNFTSPGLIVGMEELLGENLARAVAESFQ